MKDYVTIKKDKFISVNFIEDDWVLGGHNKISDIEELRIPKSLLYPKIQFTQAEKDEFDALKRRALTLNVCFGMINDFGYPHLDKRLNGDNKIGQNNLAQNEFARAWADPSLIEVIPEKKWNVRVPATSYQMYYYKLDDKISTYMASQSDLKNDKNSQFTVKELKQYGLDNDLFEKVEVQE